MQTQDVLDEPFLPEINSTSNYSERYFILAEAVVYSSTLGFKGLAFCCFFNPVLLFLTGYYFLSILSNACFSCKGLGNEQVKIQCDTECLLTGRSTTYLGNLCQCITTLTAKYFFLMANLNLSSFRLKPLHRVLLLQALLKHLSSSSHKVPSSSWKRH